tara:strand:+ start:167 stop:370 length:204 start_codon:yes stop_codon:yes gene_type:complete
MVARVFHHLIFEFFFFVTAFAIKSLNTRSNLSLGLYPAAVANLKDITLNLLSDNFLSLFSEFTFDFA